MKVTVHDDTMFFFGEIQEEHPEAQISNLSSTNVVEATKQQTNDRKKHA